MHSYSPFCGDAPGTLRLWSLSEGALVEEDGDGGSLVVVTRWGEFGIRDANAVVRESLRRMSFGPVSLHNVSPGADRGANHPPCGPPDDAISEIEPVLALLGGSVVHSLALADDQVPLLSASPLVPAPSFRPRTIPASLPVRLSRFAVLRPGDGELLLESPRAQFRVALHQPPARQVATRLAAPQSIVRVAADTGLPQSVVADIVAHLVAAGVVLVGDHDARFDEDSDPALCMWSHHELLFHAHSRSRERDALSDAVVSHAAGKTPPLTKPIPEGPRFPLHRPDITVAVGPSLNELLETDHTCPGLSEHEVTAEQVGELLYRSARIRSVGPAHLNSGVSHDASQRPYFNIAGLYELELYLSANRCTGLPRGTYHYDPREHALTLINDHQPDLDALLDLAMAAGAGRRYPPVLLTATVRLERTAWVLGGASYSTALMHFGSLQQTLYLTAQAMGLSAHAVPVDANDMVDRVLGLDWPAEVGIGECVVDRPS